MQATSQSNRSILSNASPSAFQASKPSVSSSSSSGQSSYFNTRSPPTSLHASKSQQQHQHQPQQRTQESSFRKTYEQPDYYYDEYDYDDEPEDYYPRRSNRRLREFNTSMVKDEDVDDEEDTEESQKRSWTGGYRMWILIVVVLVVLAIIGFFVYRWHHAKSAGSGPGTLNDMSGNALLNVSQTSPEFSQLFQQYIQKIDQDNRKRDEEISKLEESTRRLADAIRRVLNNNRFTPNTYASYFPGVGTSPAGMGATAASGVATPILASQMQDMKASESGAPMPKDSSSQRRR